MTMVGVNQLKIKIEDISRELTSRDIAYGSILNTDKLIVIRCDRKINAMRTKNLISKEFSIKSSEIIEENLNTPESPIFDAFAGEIISYKIIFYKET